MEVLAAIKGLERTSEGARIGVFSDSRYLVNTMTRGWKKNANQDLWQRLDELAARRDMNWQWVQGHAGHPEQEEADRLAQEQMRIAARKVAFTQVDEQGQARMEEADRLAQEQMRIAAEKGAFTHVDKQGRARMVDITQKAETEREATARGRISMEQATLELIRQGQVEKGDVLSVARTAGIMAAKRTPELIPLCHPLLLTNVAIELVLDEKRGTLDITSTVKTTGKTGAEMEALTAVAVAALTVYDMCKAVDRGMRIGDIRLVRKSGGKSGTLVLE